MCEAWCDCQEMQCRRMRTNNVVNSGLCLRHGAKVKLCSVKRCKSQAHDGVVCIWHGAKSRSVRAKEAREVRELASKMAKEKKEEVEESLDENETVANQVDVDAPLPGVASSNSY